MRGIAATAVVLYHVARHLRQAEAVPGLVHITQFGHAGVDLFFVISGFIILFVHQQDIGRLRRWTHYAARRFRRVMPVYWVALAITIAMAMAGGHAMPPPSRVLWSITLLPTHNEPILGVASTLQYELMFYALFGLLILDARVGMIVLAAWIIVILLSWAAILRIPAACPTSLFGTFNLEFLFGMVAAYLARRGAVPAPRLLFAAGAASFFTIAGLEDCGVLNGYAPSARLLYGVPSAVLILGLVEMERSAGFAPPAWLRELGGASYSIYLFQFIFIGAAWKLSLVAGNHAAWLAFPVLVGAAVGGGIVVSRLVERPILRLIGRVSATVSDPDRRNV